MRTMPHKCRDINAAGSFCDCIANAESVDPAALAFCRQPLMEGNTKTSGEGLAELKKALQDLDDG